MGARQYKNRTRPERRKKALENKLKNIAHYEQQIRMFNKLNESEKDSVMVRNNNKVIEVLSSKKLLAEKEISILSSRLIYETI